MSIYAVGVGWQNFQKLFRKLVTPLKKIVKMMTHPHKKIKMNDPLTGKALRFPIYVYKTFP